MHRIALPDWAIERGRHMNRFDRIELKRAALLVIDMQNAFMRAGEVFANPHACDIVPNVNTLAETMREVGGLVVWTRQTMSTTPPMAQPDWHYDKSNEFVRRAIASLSVGADSHRLHDALAVDPSDLVIDKYRYSAFVQNASNLDPVLRQRGIDMLIVAGTLTNVCCESTARDAYMMGYRVLFAADATAAVTDEEQNASLLNLCLNFADVRRTKELLAMLTANARPQA